MKRILIDELCIEVLKRFVGGMNQSEIARELGVHQYTVSRRIKRMESLGLLAAEFESRRDDAILRHEQEIASMAKEIGRVRRDNELIWASLKALKNEMR